MCLVLELFPEDIHHDMFDLSELLLNAEVLSNKAGSLTDVPGV